MINLHSVLLNVSAEIHDLFHVSSLKMAFIDFLSSQITDNEQFSKKYEIEKIIRKK